MYPGLFLEWTGYPPPVNNEKEKVKDQKDQSHYQEQSQGTEGGKHFPGCVQIIKYGLVDGKVPVFIYDKVREKQRNKQKQNDEGV